MDTSRKPLPVRGRRLAAAVCNQIIQHPESWNQCEWHCGTSHCVAGWIDVLAGYYNPKTDGPTAKGESVGDSVSDRAKHALGLETDHILGINIFAAHTRFDSIYTRLKGLADGTITRGGLYTSDGNDSPDPTNYPLIEAKEGRL